MLLGIDVGGTHTDAVAVDRNGVAASCKVRTDHRDLLASVRGALENILGSVDRSKIRRLNLSTTLSTNAIVEGRTEEVGVLVSSGPGIDLYNSMLCRHFHALAGSIDHHGAEAKRLDQAEVNAAVDACLNAGIRVFAVVGKFSTRNPRHENAIRLAICRGEGQCAGADFVTMGHELGGRLNFPRRTATAFFNGAVWRLYNRFADAVEKTLADLKLGHVKVNVLKADGGTFPLALSRKLPVQSIFSGPAASVMGIIALCDITHDSVILDIGGTTTDIAIFAAGAPLVEQDGIHIGSHTTLVRALKVRSIGIGGDSALSVLQGVVRVGPNRLGPAVAEGGSVPTLVDALNAAGLCAQGEAQASRSAVADLARAHGMEPGDLAQRAVQAAAQSIHEAVRELVAEINDRPVYTIHELLEGRRIVPKKVYVMGGPAQVMKMPIFRCFQLSTEVPADFAVTTRSHLIAAGGAITAARLVLDKVQDRAFALVRPPGHHAMKVVHGARGFCNINTEAVMIEWLREHYGVKRIAVVDTDCHHGDGTQDIYWHDPDVLFISMHQDGRTLYPGSGFPKECGGPTALGRTINIPLPPGTSDEGFLMALDQVVLPILADFQPELIINPAGQDNHFTDPITNMNVSAQGYAELNRRLAPHIAVLEGGYAIQGALPYVNLGICLAMAGLDFGGVREPNYEPERLRQPKKVTDYVKEVCDLAPKLYFDPPKEPKDGVFADNWFVRRKNIYYDTDEITEAQTEMLHLCGQCRGLLKIESRSTNNPLCLGLEIPRGACDSCRNMGYKILEESQLKGEFRYIQFVDRRDKEYVRYGF